MTTPHVPVMVDEVVALLADAPAGPILDATVGAGGHATAIARARRHRHGRAGLLGIDRDPNALALAAVALGELADVEVRFSQVGFDAMRSAAREHAMIPLSGILMDLGMSSMQLDRADRGFSIRHDGPLDMRMGPDAAMTAAELVARVDLAELTTILRDFGEERHARRVARAIKDAGEVTSTGQLADIVVAAMPPGAAAKDRGHPARRTFQALRIAVNDELGALRRALPEAIDLLVPGGVLVVLAYHSLEDRIVKTTFATAAADCICPPGLPVCACSHEATVAPLVRRPARPTPEEISRNSRASAARLRAVTKLEDQ